MSKIERLYWEEEMAKVATKSDARTPQFFKSAKEVPYETAWLPNCRHWRQPFELEEGKVVFASAWLDKPDRAGPFAQGGFSGQPDVGFYLDPKWASSRIVASVGAKLPFAVGRRDGGTTVIYPWEDWGVPENAPSFRRALAWLLKQICGGKVVEVGCMGAHGRTGTALACMLVLQGLSAKMAIHKIWTDYCEEAIETQRQIDFIKTLAMKRKPS